MSTGDLLFRDVAAAVAVAQYGHFGRAAESLRVPQPTLSAQVRKVERALGAALFERTGRSFLVTPEGARLLPLLRRVLADAEVLDRAAPGSTGATAFGRGPRTPGIAAGADVRATHCAAPALRVGVIPTLGPHLMPHLLSLLGRRRESWTIEISELPTARLLEGLHDGSLDAALVSLPVQRPALEAIPLFDEPFRLIAPRGHELLAAERLAPSRLRVDEMILLEEGHCLREQAIALCSRRGGVTPRVVTTSLETLKYLVAAGNGYSLLPELACALSADLKRLVGLRAFDDRPPVRRIALVLRRTLPRRADAVELAHFIRTHAPRRVTVAE